MPTIATLRVLVTASAGPFKKALTTAAGQARAFGQSIGRIGLQVAKFGAGIGIAAVGGLALLTKQAYSAIDALGKLSSNIGVSTEGLAAFHLAAELGGVGTEAMDKALVKMQRSVGQAGQGLQTQVRAFKSLGLTFEQLAAMTPEQQLAAIADGVKGIGSASERAAVLADIFGRSGVELTNILAGGAESFAAIQKEADALGLSLSRIETKQVEDANDAFLKVRRALTGIGRQIALATAPVVEWLSKKFTEAAEAGGGIREKVGGALNSVIGIIGGVLDGVDILKQAWLGMQGLILKGLEIVSRHVEQTVESIIHLFNLVLPESVQFNDIGVKFSDAFTAGIEDIDEQVKQILLGPSGRERVSKFFGMVTDESKRAAEKALAAQTAVFNDRFVEDTEAARDAKEKEKRLEIGFRDAAFAAALRANVDRPSVTSGAPTKSEMELTRAREILEGIDRFLKQTNIGLI